MRLPLLFCALWLPVLSACATTPPPDVRAGESPLPVTLHVSGGIAGIRRHITVAPEGTLTVEDEQRGESRTRQLASDEVAGIARLLAALPATAPSPLRPGCADCIHYALEYSRDGIRIRTNVPERTADSPYAPLLRRLISLAAEAR